MTVAAAMATAAICLLSAPALAQDHPDQSLENVEKASWHFKAAKAAFLARRLDEAIAELNTVMQLDPQPIVMYNMARVLEEKGETGSAVEWYLKALRSGLSGELATSATARAEVLSKIKQEAAATEATLSVVVAESEARIFLDDKLLGQGTLRQIAVAPGPRRVKVEHPSFETWQKEITLAAADKIVLDVSLVPLAKVGSLSVMSTLSGAALTVDGQPAGLLPVENLSVTPGKHALRVEAEGYDPFVTEVTVAERASVVVNAALAPSDNSGRLLIETDVVGAQVSIDGQLVGTTPLAAVKLSPGKHALSVQAEGFHVHNKDVVVPPRQLLMYNVPLVSEDVSIAGPGGQTIKGAVQYDSYVGLYMGYESIPAEIEGDDRTFARENFVVGVEYAPKSLTSGIDMRFWAGARLPTGLENPDDELSEHTGYGAAMFLNAHVTIIRRVEIFGGGGLQYFYNGKGDEGKIDEESWHELSCPVGGGVSVRPWEWALVSPQFLYVYSIPEMADMDHESYQSNGEYWLFRVTLGFAFDNPSF